VVLAAIRWESHGRGVSRSSGPRLLGTSRRCVLASLAAAISSGQVQPALWPCDPGDRGSCEPSASVRQRALARQMFQGSSLLSTETPEPTETAVQLALSASSALSAMAPSPRPFFTAEIAEDAEQLPARLRALRVLRGGTLLPPGSRTVAERTRGAPPFGMGG